MVIGYSSKHLMDNGLPPKILVSNDDSSAKQWYVPERTCHITEYEHTGIPVCSECGAVQPEDHEVYYCWSCGAKVEVDQDARDLRDAIAADDGKRYSMSEVMDLMEDSE